MLTDGSGDLKPLEARQILQLPLNLFHCCAYLVDLSVFSFAGFVPEHFKFVVCFIMTSIASPNVFRSKSDIFLCMYGIMKLSWIDNIGSLKFSMLTTLSTLVFGIPTAYTLPTYMLGQLRRTVTPEVNAISTVLLAAGVVLVTFFFMLNRKGR